MGGFGIKKDVTANVTPSEIVNFDQLTPTTVGVVFDPDTPQTTDVLYVSSVDASTWIWNGSAYVTYTAPTTASTEWYLYGTTIDAGSNKTANITRSGAVDAGNFGTRRFLTPTGASDSNKWWKVLDYAINFNYAGSSFKIQMNEWNNAGGSGKSIIFDIIVKRQDPSSYVTVNIDSGVTTFDLSNFEVLYDSTTQKITFYYRPTTSYTYTNWLVLNMNGGATFYNTLIGASLAGQPNNALTSKVISLNKVNGVYTLPPARATVAGQVLADPLADGTLAWVTSGGGGKWGIANASGLYTYYATYQLAVASAVAGQTIEMFGSQTESTANHILKNGVNINYNGYTLTFGGLFRLDDNNVACDVQLLNGEIKQPTTDGFCIVVFNAGTVIRGNVLINSSGTNSLGIYGPATIYGLNFKGSYCVTLYSVGAKGKAYGVTINCTSNIAFAWGEIYNSVINSTSTNGRALQYVTNVVNCSGTHNGFVSVYCDGVNMRNCSFTNLTSDILAFITQDNNFFDSCYFRCAGNTLGNGPGNGKNLMTNCKISTFSYAYAFGSGVINMDNCVIISDTSYTFNQPAAGKFNKCTFIVRDGSNSFHEPATSVIKLNNCDFQLFNASAYPVYSSSAKNFTASNNTYNTTNFQLNMTNLQTYTADAVGNQRLN
jgi:hypothetical protein